MTTSFYQCRLCGWARIVLEGETFEDARGAHEATDIHWVYTVPCLYPRREDHPMRVMPPEELGDEWATDDRCTHDHCIEVAGYARAYEAHRRVTLTPDEREAIESDRELMLDEFHGGPLPR